MSREDRDGLERLCRYGLRAPFAQERLSLREDGRVVYELSRPWPNSAGVTELVLEPGELLHRLAALVPGPYVHLVRYHGIFASRSKYRSRLPAPPPRVLPEGVESWKETPLPPTAKPAREVGEVEGETAEPNRRERYSWAQLLHRVFFVDALLCTKCGGRMKVLSVLTDPDVVKKILEHLGLEAAAPPLVRARPDWSSWDGSEDAAPHGPMADEDWGRRRAPP